MANYDIVSNDFALSDEGIHLLRNRFNYRTINFYEVQKATFTKAVDTRNPVFTIIAGVLLIAFAVYQAIGVFEDFNDPTVHHIYIQSILLPVLPILTGFYCIYISIKKVPLLIIVLDEEKYKLSLQGFISAGRLEVVEKYLKEKLRESFYESAITYQL